MGSSSHNANGLRHNKKRNTGIVFECLIRKMSQGILENNTTTFNKAKSLITKYFIGSQPLNKEKQLFDALNNTNGVTTQVARGILNEVLQEAKKLDFKLLDIKKSNLLKEIHQAFGKSFFSEYRIEDYKVLATIQLLINDQFNHKSLTTTVEKVKLQEALVNHMSLAKQKVMTEVILDKELLQEFDGITYSIAVNKFNDKYTETLNENQKTLLKKFIVLSPETDLNKLNKFLTEEKNKIVILLTECLSVKEVAEDKLIAEKVNNLNKQVKNISSCTDDSIETLLMCYKLIEELKN